MRIAAEFLDRILLNLRHRNALWRRGVVPQGPCGRELESARPLGGLHHLQRNSRTG